MNEQDFITSPGDGYAIYQLKQDASTRDLRFASMAQVEKSGRKVERENYDLVYTGRLETTDKPAVAILEELYARFNLNHPVDFTGHSLSMSDIIVLRQSGSLSAHYVDTFGFQEVKDFLPEEIMHSLATEKAENKDRPEEKTGKTDISPVKAEKKPKERLPLSEQLKLAAERHNSRMRSDKSQRNTGLER